MTVARRPMIRVLVVEDGTEYIDTFGRFVPGFDWHRAGSGPEALARLAAEPFDALFCDMRFDRVPIDRLLGDIGEAADRFNGDPEQARHFLENYQGNYILAALRDAGWGLPVLMSHDFEAEPRRWQRIVERYGPVEYLPDNAGPGEVGERLRRLLS